MSDVSARILARMSVSVSVSASWNSSCTGVTNCYAGRVRKGVLIITTSHRLVLTDFISRGCEATKLAVAETNQNGPSTRNTKHRVTSDMAKTVRHPISPFRLVSADEMMSVEMKSDEVRFVT